MRTQQPHHTSQRDVVVPGGELPDYFPGRGLCCPDDPLDLVLQLFPVADRGPPPAASLAALGIGGGAGGGGGEPPLRVIKQEPESPPLLAESACGGGGGGVGGLKDSWGGLSSFLPEGLWSGLDDVDMFFADDDALDAGTGGGEATEGNNLLCDPMMEAKPKPPPAHMEAAAAAGPVHVHTRGLLGGAVVPNDASPLPSPMPAGAFPLQANASPPPVFVTNNSTPPLPALMAPAAPAPMPPAAGLRACGALPVIVSNGPPAPPPLAALIMPAGPAPMPPAASLHACGAWPGIVSNVAPAPPPLMALMPARALHPNAAAWAGVYSSTNAPAAHAPPSATPSSSPPSLASSGSGRCPSSSPSSEPEFLQTHHVWAVPRKPRSPPPVSRRRRPWVLEFPLHALPPVVALLPPANPVVDDAKNQNAGALMLFVPPPGNTCGDNDSAAAGAGGGIRRRRPAPRQRNRQAQRVCSHCHSPETPQWRAGPDGPGTLCNACGIRYAANRLLPEYRPSTAPSFRSGQHSNRHRKVIKLREQQMKVATEEEKPSSEQLPPVKPEHVAAMEKDDDGFMGVCEYISAAGL